MKNKLSDLNNHLIAQIERLSEEGLSPEKVEQEARRGEAMVAVADQVLRLAAIQLQAAKIAADHGGDARAYLPEVSPSPKLIEAAPKKLYEDVGE